MDELVLFETKAGVGVITINNPPVNALSTRAAEGVGTKIDQAIADPSVRAVVIVGKGRSFTAGADINELAAGNGGPDLHGLFEKIEDSSKPVVVAIHGTTLGGGVELAMAAHYRVALPDAQLGLPEVNLGIIPGGEGTQRLPRLVGVAKAAEMLVSGRPIMATEAHEVGLIDRIIEGDLGAGAIAFAREVVKQASPTPKTREQSKKLGTAELNGPIFAAAREQARKTRRNQTAPLVAIEALEAATTLPFDQGRRKERELCAKCLASDQAKALFHAFLGERLVAKLPGISKETPVIPIRNAAIIGAGTMGGGIAMALANAGISVRIKDAEQASLDRGMATIRKNYENSVKKGRISQAVMNQRLAMICPQLSYEHFDEADIIIEAAFENMALKKKIFSEIDKVANPNCILASNTSTLNIDEIASATSRPAMFIGMHFFSPANVMRLVETVRGKATANEVIASTMALAKTLHKVGVLVGNCPGFVGNRMMLPYMREAQFLLEEGAKPQQVDSALTDWGMAMGILAVDDMAGIDVAWRVGQEFKHLRKPGVRRPLVLDKLYEMGRLGQKTGAGWYRYDETRKPIPDPIVENLIESMAKEDGIAQRTIQREEILERCLYIMINEGAKILEEGYALRANDIDIIYLTGYGFPAYRGGPMWYADTVGLKEVYGRIESFHKLYGQLWEPALLLRRLAEQGKTFAYYDATKESVSARA